MISSVEKKCLQATFYFIGIQNKCSEKYRIIGEIIYVFHGNFFTHENF